MKALLLGASLLLAFPAAAAAQSANSGPSLPPPPPNIRVSGMINSVAFEPTAAQSARLRRDGGGTSSQRRERAERLAEMVNSGQCQAAHDIAVREGDRIMAERIGDVCRPSSDPTPAA